MKPRKSFAEHIAADSNQNQIAENLLSKGYAVAQNAQHNTASQKINSLASKIASISHDVKIEADPVKKINKLCDAVFAMSELFKAQSQQSTNIKNVVVAHALLEQSSKIR